MLSNLISNAVTHGSAGAPVTVTASQKDDSLEISVTNKADALTPQEIEMMFQPFRRNDRSADGLGLGLYISLEIARAHGGTLTATSDHDSVSFTFSMPLA